MSAGRSLRPAAAFAAAVALAVAGPPAASAHPPGVTELISAGIAGAAGDSDSRLASISGDGRFVAFSSDADNLVPGEPQDSASDVYLRDVVSGTTEGISTASAGVLRHSGGPSISNDARLVAYHAWDGGLVPGDTNDRYDVFVLDRSSGVTERVSVDSTGVEGNNDSTGPSISADGRFVAFTSDADNLVPGDGNFDIDVFVHDRMTQATVRASVRTDGSAPTDRRWPSSPRSPWCRRTPASRSTCSCTTSSPSRGHRRR